MTYILIAEDYTLKDGEAEIIHEIILNERKDYIVLKKISKDLYKDVTERIYVLAEYYARDYGIDDNYIPVTI